MSARKIPEALCRRLAVRLAAALPTLPFEYAGQMTIRVPVRWIVERWLGWDLAAYNAEARKQLRAAAMGLRRLALAEDPATDWPLVPPVKFLCRLNRPHGWELNDELAFSVVRGHPRFRPGIGEDELEFLK